MLRELYELAAREELVGDSAFEVKPVAWIISLAKDGDFLGYVSTHSPAPAKGKGKAKPKDIAKKFIIPRQFVLESGGTRTRAPYAYFMVDKSDYVLGCAPDGKAHQPAKDEKMIERHQLFIDRIAECYKETQLPQLAAVLAFLRSVQTSGLPEALPKKSAAGDLFAFEVEPNPVGHVHEMAEVRDYWRKLCQKGGADSTGLQCLITGENIIAPSLFPMVKQAPGANALAGVVSFNKPAFESYGWKSNANAPIAADAGQAAAVALNRLVDPAFQRQDGKVLPKRHYRLPDTAICFWSRGKKGESLADDLTALIDADDAGKVGDAFHSIWRGVAPLADLDGDEFYGVTLNGVQGRVIVRDYWESSTADALKSMAEYFKQLSLPPNTAPAKGKDPSPNYGFRRLRECLTSTGKADDLPDQISSGIFTAFINRKRRFPDSLLATALERMRAEASGGDWIDSTRRDARTALIKAILIRNHHQTIEPTMNEDNEQPGYLLGRLFACIEQMQYLALGGDLNKNIAARYFAAASSTPRLVFPALNQSLNTHYYRKALSRKPKLADDCLSVADQINGLMAKHLGTREPFPARLPLVEQGHFSIGYHVQRHAFSPPKKKIEKSNTPTSTEEPETTTEE